MLMGVVILSVVGVMILSVIKTLQVPQGTPTTPIDFDNARSTLFRRCCVKALFALIVGAVAFFELTGRSFGSVKAPKQNLLMGGVEALKAFLYLACAFGGMWSCKQAPATVVRSTHLLQAMVGLTFLVCIATDFEAWRSGWWAYSGVDGMHVGIAFGLIQLFVIARYYQSFSIWSQANQAELDAQSCRAEIASAYTIGV
jgi:hypothetical protein